MNKYKSLVVMDPDYIYSVYDEETLEGIKSNSDLLMEPISRDQFLEKSNELEDVEVIFSGWKGPHFDKDLLSKLPNLKCVFYAAGSIKKIVTEEFWNRGIRITTANAVNAIPVAEYTLAATIFSLKNTQRMNKKYCEDKEFVKLEDRNIKGGYRPKIGLISLGAIAQKVLEFYKMFDYDVYVYDPFVTESRAQDLNVTLLTLDELFEQCDVVSLHSPLLDVTKGMIKKHHFLSMKKDASFINTSRGAIIAEDEMIEALQIRHDITAYLDVVYPEPPLKTSLLYTLENVFLTPHIAGSEGSEVARMGNAMLNEFIKFNDGGGLDFEVSKEQFEVMA